MKRTTYTIEATVRRSNGEDRKIEWEYDGRGSGTSAWRAWCKMAKTNATMDTQEPFVKACILRNGEPVESIGY